jgi:hypothetical protein
MREADAIELLDMQLYLVTKGYQGEPFVDITRHSSSPLCPELVNVGQSFSLDLSEQPQIRRREYRKGAKRTQPGDIELRSFPGGHVSWACDRVEAEVNDGCLDIRVTSVNSDRSRVMDFRYGGRFVIHWTHGSDARP